MHDKIEILLVEDNPDDAELAIRALRKQGYADKLLWVKNGREALDYLFPAALSDNRDVKHSLKVIFLDLKIPYVDGLGVLQRIKADERTRTIPVVMLTSSAEPKDIAESYRLGANSYIVKPIAYEDFAKTVSELGAYWLTMNKTSE